VEGDLIFNRRSDSRTKITSTGLKNMTSDPISGAGTPNRVGEMSGAGFAPSSINPENIMFSAMMSRSQELANLMNSYYEGIQTENQQMAHYNDVMSQLDAYEANASALGPNNTVQLDNGMIAELNAMGLSPSSADLNSTSLAQLNDSVKNQVTNLSTQSETDMDQLQELSNNYNTVSQEISSFISSITQTNQQIASNLK
jgi:ABC-type enterochelin transport system substrate-binding protein